MTSDISSPNELEQFDSFDWYGSYDGWERDEQRVREQRPRLEQIFGLPFTFEGRVAWQDGSLLCVLYAEDACRASGSFGEYFDLGHFSFSFSMFGQLFTVQTASRHSAVTPERIAEATNIFRDLGFVFCPNSILRSPYPQSPDMPLPTWADRFFSSAF
jgi:hypothetical protein